MKPLEKLNAFIKEQTPLKKEDSLLIALSGGPDSQVLIEMMIKMGFTNLTAAHVNYHTRETDSYRDEVCAMEWANKLKVPFLKKDIRIQSSQGNFQDIAREARYKWFEQIMKDRDSKYVLTAHHKNDQHETMVMRFFLGTRGHGLTGISTVLENRVRPLLCLTKTEILDYAREHGIPFQTDKSNLKSQYLRNFFRNEVFPLVDKKIQGLTKRLETTQRHITREQQLLYHFCLNFIASHAYWNGEMAIISTEKLPNYELKTGLLCLILDLNENQAEQILKSGHNHVLQYPPWEVSYFNEKLWLQRSSNMKLFKTKLSSSFPLKVNLPGGHLTVHSTSTIQFSRNAQIEYIPIRNNMQNFVIKSWEEGDRFEIQSGHHKKVSDLLNENHLSPLEKAKVCCLWEGDKLLWVIGLRLSTAAYVEDTDSTFAKLSYHPFPKVKKDLQEVKFFLSTH